MIVIHCTELPDLRVAREYAERIIYPSGTGNCGHFYIDTDGQTYQWVDLERVAHHVRGFNTTSIGIELSHPGRYPNWYHADDQDITQNYPQQQITSLLKLLDTLKISIPALRFITGHEQLDTEMITAKDQPNIKIRRKIDPGPTFPWATISKHTQLSFLETTEDYE
ncbi:N-acetylmuramoyl-L-alanine amidase [Marinicella sp. W31]|uniref:N-acetylmuramoyl-L-alanine amidase n=1 Tax=Marinicella sp. W31 TaxID=3023713 RepID=UPI0037575C89